MPLIWVPQPVMDRIVKLAAPGTEYSRVIEDLLDAAEDGRLS